MRILEIINYLLMLIHVEAVPSKPKVIQITEPVDHAECPSWDPRIDTLYFVNIHQGEIYRYDYATRTNKSIKLDGEVAPVVQSKNNINLLIAGLNRSLVAVEWDGESPPSPTRNLVSLSQQFPTSRVNDGKADKQGRFWIGTMGYEDSNGVTPNQGVLYEVTCNPRISDKVKIAPVNISNGMAWNKANDRFFYIDTPTRQIAGYFYDDATGDITHKYVVFDLNKHDKIQGNPDGMTIDEDDNLWIALYGGGAVIKVNSRTGRLLQTVHIPARDVSSTMWGGPNLDVLFVTTSRVALNATERLQQPKAGAVFKIIGLGTKGRPVFEANLLDSIDDQKCG